VRGEDLSALAIHLTDDTPITSRSSKPAHARRGNTERPTGAPEMRRAKICVS
jgi:hypothetical protein